MIRHFLPRAEAGLSLGFCLQRAEPQAPHFSFPAAGAQPPSPFTEARLGEAAGLRFSLTELGTRKGLISQPALPGSDPPRKREGVWPNAHVCVLIPRKV